MHGAAFTAGIAARASCQFRHDAARLHAASEHVAVITIARNHLVALNHSCTTTRHNGLLADIKVTETCDLAHSVKLSGFFFKAAYQQHITIIFEQFVFIRFEKLRF